MSTKFGLETFRVEKREIPAPKVTIMLDMPPSANHLFFNVRGKGRVKTKEYTDWRERNSWFIKQQRPQRISGPVEVRIFFEDQHPRRDADNGIKACLDLIADSGVGIIDGDHSQVVRKISAEWADVKGVKIEIRRAA